MKADATKFSDYLGASLFTGAGIGDIGFRAAGINFIVFNEIDPKRASLAQTNFPETEGVIGDIWQSTGKIIDSITRILKDKRQELFFMSCTAPCQGMSKNGRGKLLNLIRQGKRPKLDPRNRLILPALDIITRIRPLWVFFENVIEMKNTVIEDDKGKLRSILEIIETKLGGEYVGKAYDVEFADYGIPQRRQRLITVYTRSEIAKELLKKGFEFIPPTTHAVKPDKTHKKWVSVNEALKDFPPLDAKSPQLARNNSIPFHYVPVLEPIKYWWIENTPPKQTAFNNQCVNPRCMYQHNKEHRASHTKEGINKAHKDTPVYCEKCGTLLPRPSVKTPNGKRRIMSGYTSAYKRMDGDLPAPAITRNLSFPCSDNKIHPTQNRVLSLAEAFRLHTLSDFEYKWGANGNRPPDTLIRLVLGESIPPKFTRLMGEYIISISSKDNIDLKSKIYNISKSLTLDNF